MLQSNSFKGTKADLTIFKASILLALMFISNGCSAGGLSEESQQLFIGALADYHSTEKETMKAKDVASEIDTSCDPNQEYPYVKQCIEKKYMFNGLYKVFLTFKNDHRSSVTLPTIIENESWQFNGADLESFHSKWRQPVLTEYIGSDFEKFSYAHIKSLNKRYITVELHVSEAEELTEVVKDERLVGGYHVASPERAPEEIID